MRLLITGATGFIGTHACRVLSAGGHEVFALARTTNKVYQGCHAVHDDGSLEGITAAVEATAPDAVIHLATYFVKDHRATDLSELIRTNITYGCTVLEAAVAAGCTRFLIAGTTWQHDQADGPDYRPANLYAATKQAFEDIALWYACRHRIAITALHFGDTYGPNDSRRKIFGLLQEAKQSGKPLLLSPGHQRLDPLYVLDAVEAMRVAIQRPSEGFSVFRVTPGKPLTLREIVAVWCEVNGATLDLRWGALPYRDSEVMEPWCGGELLPGWQPQRSLREGLAEVAAYADG